MCSLNSLSRPIQLYNNINNDIQKRRKPGTHPAGIVLFIAIWSDHDSHTLDTLFRSAMQNARSVKTV